MARTLKSDKTLFLATLALVVLSVVMVYSASAVQAAARYDGRSYWFLSKQLAWAVIGTGLMLVVMRVDYHRYARPAVVWGSLAVTAVLLVSVFFFSSRNGAHRWITLGVVSIQPSEIAKLVLILFMASLLERRMHRVNDPALVLVPVCVVTGIGLALILPEPDLGTAAVIAGVVGVMIFAAGLSYRYIFGLALAVLPVVAFLIMGTPYRRQRIYAFLHPESDPFDTGFQILHSIFAVGTGGIFGKGLMAGIEKLYYIPEPHTDFIFAVIAEELGLIGTTLTLLCFAVIAWRGWRACLLAPDRFGSLLALGITTMVTLQAFFNISVVTVLLPTKGIPLPFVSNGGSSLLINLVAMGILLNISQQGSATAAAEISRDGTAWTLEGQEA